MDLRANFSTPALIILLGFDQYLVTYIYIYIYIYIAFQQPSQTQRNWAQALVALLYIFLSV